MADLSDLRQRIESARDQIVYVQGDRSPTAAEVNERLSGISGDLQAASDALAEVDELATELAEERIAHQKTLEQLREAREQVGFEKHRGATLGGDLQFLERQHRSAVADIARVRRLHFQYRGVSDYDVCAHCSRHAALSGVDAPWPCDTIKALNGEGSRG